MGFFGEESNLWIAESYGASSSISLQPAEICGFQLNKFCPKETHSKSSKENQHGLKQTPKKDGQKEQRKLLTGGRRAAIEKVGQNRRVSLWSSAPAVELSTSPALVVHH